MEEEKYEEMIENDIISAILVFQEMSIPNRIKAVLYILDNLDVCGENMGCLLKDNIGAELLMLIRAANKGWSKNVEKFKSQGLESSEANISANNQLIEDAAEMYYKKYPNERPVDIITEDIIAEEEVKVKNFYRLLT